MTNISMDTDDREKDAISTKYFFVYDLCLLGGIGYASQEISMRSASGAKMTAVIRRRINISSRI
jgi:hypothetical protein